MYINNNIITQVTSFKFLGIVIDNKLSWKLHIDYLASKLARNLSILYKLKGNVPQFTMINMYYSFVYSLLTYGITVWGSSSKGNLNKLLLLQKQAIRVITNSSYRAHTDSLFKSLKVLKIQDIFFLEVLQFVYKFKLGKLPCIFSNLFTFNTRQSRQQILHIPIHRTNYRAASITVVGAKIFNEFHRRHNVELISINNFKKLFNNFTLSNY